MIKVVIFDEQETFRAGLRAVFEPTVDIRVCGDTDRGHDALRMSGEDGADMLILELPSIGRGGIEFVLQAKRRFPQLLVLVLTAQRQAYVAARALRAGASGFLTKVASCAEIVEAVRKVAAGRVYVCKEVAEQLMVKLHDRSEIGGHEALTEREFDIFVRIARGETITQIARILMLSAKTVSTHKARFLEKMNMSSTSEVVQYAVAHRLIDDYAR